MQSQEWKQEHRDEAPWKSRELGVGGDGALGFDMSFGGRVNKLYVA